MKQDITLTIETSIRTDAAEVMHAIERLAVNVLSVDVGKPYDRNPERDGE